MKKEFTLSEGATHVDTSNNIHQLAFTLAEVLITLGIIGVVAAMTMPTLIANYQKKVWVNQLKKSVNTIQNNLRKIMADEGVDSVFDTEIAYKNNPNQSGQILYGIYTDKFASYSNYNLISPDSLKNSFLKESLYDIAVLPDGSCLENSVDTGFTSWEDSSFQIKFIVDINCDKAPNKVGRDIFTLVFNPDASIVVAPEDELGVFKDVCTKDMYEQIYSSFSSSSSDLSALGMLCSMQIIRDGWKMNY